GYEHAAPAQSQLTQPGRYLSSAPGHLRQAQLGQLSLRAEHEPVARVGREAAGERPAQRRPVVEPLLAPPLGGVADPRIRCELTARRCEAFLAHRANRFPSQETAASVPSPVRAPIEPSWLIRLP